MEESLLKAKLFISRHRIGTDGNGVRTLVSFSGCPLNCRYCLNPELRDDSLDGTWYTPEELFRELEKDRYYFLTTCGGVTFGGGEPLLHSGFIKAFCEFPQMNWSVNVETCLNVSEDSVREVAPYVDTFIVDVKDTSPAIYSKYTGSRDVARVLSNLNVLKEEAVEKYGRNVIVRLPNIPGYNTKEDIERSIDVIKDGYEGSFSIDVFNYVTDRSGSMDVNGHEICKILKKIRRELIKENGLSISQPVCKNKGNCPGTCPACEAELSKINGLLGEDGNYTETANKMYEARSRYRLSNPHIIDTECHLLGIMVPEPIATMGNMNIEICPEVLENEEQSDPKE